MKEDRVLRAGPILGLVVLTMTLTGCGDGGDTRSAASALTPQEAMARLEASGEIPVLERGASLGGIDDNHNGVRDDIERYIESRYAVSAERDAAMQLAGALQQMLLVDKSDAIAMQATLDASTRAMDCIFDTFVQPDGFLRGSQLSTELEAITSNTKERLKAYLAFNRAASGSVSGSFKGQGCN